MTATFSNPVIPGFAPDPSIICVNRTYFLVNSSFHVFPGLPIYASKNLKDWTQIGNAINRPSQLSLDHSFVLKYPTDTGELIGACGLLAPTLRYHAGIFYIICTNVSVSESSKFIYQNFYISTQNIWSDKWSDPIYYEWEGIDPSLFFDDDGRAYVQGQWALDDRAKQPTGTIKQVEIDIGSGKLLTNPQEIWGGWAKLDTEGPHLYKKDGWYFILVAEGGTYQHHLLSIARSKNIWGPYEAYEKNPVLTADGKDEYIQNTGHGDIFQDAEGQWWAAVLGIRQGIAGRNTMGRETFLTQVDWPVGGWPSFLQPKTVMSRVSKVLNLPPDLEHTPGPGLDLIHQRDFVAENYIISSDCKNIQLVASQADFSAARGTCTFVGKRQRNLDAVVTATISLTGSCESRLDAGLVVYKDNYRHAEIFHSASKNRVVFSWENYRTGRTEVVEAEEFEGADVQFKIEATEDRYVFFFQGSRMNWMKMGVVDTLELTCQDFTGPIFGVFAFGQGQVEFEDVQLV